MQTYDVQKGRLTVAKNRQQCTGLSDQELLDFLKATVFPDVVIEKCAGDTPEKPCDCRPRAVPPNDPSWTEPKEYTLDPFRTLTRRETPAGGGAPIECTYTISGTIRVRSRIDDKGVCLPGGDKI